jgi:hypothetical protein
MGGASTVCSRPVASTTVSFALEFFIVSPSLKFGEPDSDNKGVTRAGRMLALRCWRRRLCTLMAGPLHKIAHNENSDHCRNRLPGWIIVS